MQLGGWAIYLTSVLSSTTPDSIIYSKDYRLWGGNFSDFERISADFDAIL
jgi:hypothetical protein